MNQQVIEPKLDEPLLDDPLENEPRVNEPLATDLPVEVQAVVEPSASHLSCRSFPDRQASADRAVIAKLQAAVVSRVLLAVSPSATTRLRPSAFAR